jgi:hypothetical protein
MQFQQETTIYSVRNKSSVKSTKGQRPAKKKHKQNRAEQYRFFKERTQTRAKDTHRAIFLPNLNP